MFELGSWKQAATEIIQPRQSGSAAQRRVKSNRCPRLQASARGPTAMPLISAQNASSAYVAKTRRAGRNPGEDEVTLMFMDVKEKVHLET